ncbi:MAG: HK97 family phage prohead protease [Gammaproteobacteria bacterium]
MARREQRAVQSRFSIETREDGALPTIVGYAAVYEAETVIFNMFREKLRRGAFRRAVEARQDVRALFNHNPDFLLGRVGAGTLRLYDDDHGLRVEIDPPNTPTGREVVELIRRGDIYGMSFGFIPTRVSWEQADESGLGLRVVEDVDLVDVSPVTYPAYEQTEVGIRSSAEAVIQERTRQLRSAYQVMRMRLRLAETA